MYLHNKNYIITLLCSITFFCNADVRIKNLNMNQREPIYIVFVIIVVLGLFCFIEGKFIYF